MSSPRTLLCSVLASLAAACSASVVPSDGGNARDAGGAVDARTDAPALPDTATVDAAIDATPDVACAPGQRACGARCVDTESDPRNCGACGHVCPAITSACGCGRCFGDCATSETVCCRSGPGSGPVCLDLQADPEHCGACDAPCAADQFCSGGRCVDAMLECDPRRATCDAQPPSCTAGQVPWVRGSCWAGCAAFERCIAISCDAATATEDCPAGWTCDAGTNRCRP